MVAAVVAVGMTMASVSSAWAQADDLAQRRALTRQYIEVVNLTKILDAMSSSLVASMTRGAKVPADMDKALRESVSEGMAAVTPRVLDDMIDMYAAKFTAEELNALVAFYGSPVGKSITVKTEELTIETGPLMQKYVPLMQREMLTRLCGKIECPAQFKEAIKTLEAGA